MKNLRLVKYPKNRNEAIRFVKALDVSWQGIQEMPKKLDKCKEIVRINKEVKSVLKSLDKIRQNDKKAQDAYQILLFWRSRHLGSIK